MKTYLRLGILICLLQISRSAISQQVEYHYFDSREGIRIEYRWTRANILDRNSDALLYLQLTNDNDFPAQIVFRLGFYRDDQLILESEDNVLCLKPGQRRRGSRSDMRFSAEGINMAMVEEEWFSWDIIVFEVEEAACK